MHSVCIVRPSPRGSSVHMRVLDVVGSLVYTQAINRCGFSPRGTHLVDCDQGFEYLIMTWFCTWIVMFERMSILPVSMLNRFSPRGILSGYK